MIKHQRKLDGMIVLLGALFFLISLQLLISNKIIEYIIFIIRGLLFYKLFFYVINLKKQFFWFYFLLFIYYLLYGYNSVSTIEVINLGILKVNIP